MQNEKVLLEILSNRFTGVVEEMGYVIHRAAFSIFIKETWDFDSALISPSGEVFCYPRNIGVTNMLGIDLGPAIRAIKDYRPGDVIITNDPLTTEGMCTHKPDIMMFRPVFHQDKLICFLWCFVHCSDVGGLVPGSIAPTAYDHFQEGLTIPPRKLYSAGVLDEDLRDLILANCRTPKQNWGDMKALLAALAVGEKRIGQTIEQFGVDTIRTGIDRLLDYGERRARAIFADLPDGDYEFSDYVEIDFATKFFARIKLKVTISGSDVMVDFTGTDAQVRAAINLPTQGKLNQWIVLGIVNYLRTADRSLPLNKGILRSVKVNIPQGTILNPTRNAATGVRHASGYRVSDAMLGALSRAVPEQIPSAGAGGTAIILMSRQDPRRGHYTVNVLQPMAGGSGARPTKDGIDGAHFSAGSLRNVPTESIEVEEPVIVNQYRLSNEVAAGAQRGGAAIIFEFECLAPDAILTARGMDRFRIRPWGRKGGRPGTLGATVLNPGTDHEKQIGKIDVLHLRQGDVVRVTTPGGAGYGLPIDRKVEAVARDVKDGFVSLEEARKVYGVVFRDGTVDAAETEGIRRSMRNGQAVPEYDFGSERADYETALPTFLQDAVAELALEFEPAMRPYVRDKLYPILISSRWRDHSTRLHDLKEELRGILAEGAMAAGAS
jgi:N-methylhydantoinase B